MGYAGGIKILIKTVRGHMLDEIAPAKSGSYLAR